MSYHRVLSAPDVIDDLLNGACPIGGGDVTKGDPLLCIGHDRKARAVQVVLIVVCHIGGPRAGTREHGAMERVDKAGVDLQALDQVFVVLVEGVDVEWHLFCACGGIVGV